MAAELTEGAAELAEGAAELQSPWSSLQDVSFHVSHLHSPHPLSRPIPSALVVSLLSRALAPDLTCPDDCTDTDSDVGSFGGVEVKDVVGAEGCGTDGWAETAGHVGGAEPPCRSGTSRSSRLSPGGQAVWHFDISKGDLDDEEQDYCPSGVCTPRTPRRSSVSRSIACDQLSPPKLSLAGFPDQLKLQESVKQTDFVAVPVWPLCVVVELPADFNRRTFPADNALLEPQTVEICDMPPLEPHVFETCEMPSLEPHRSDIREMPPLEPHMFETSSEYRVADAASRAAYVRDLRGRGEQIAKDLADAASRARKPPGAQEPLEPHVFESCEMPPLEPHIFDNCEVPPPEPHIFEIFERSEAKDLADLMSRARKLRELRAAYVRDAGSASRAAYVRDFRELRDAASRAAYVRDLRRRDLQHHARKLHGVEHLVRARPCRGVPAGAEPQLVALAVASVPVPECTSGNLGGPRAVVGAEPESSEIYDERFPSLV